MSLCLAAGAVSIALGWSQFTLAWTHSVQKTAWEEDYRIAGAELIAVEARVKGSGAGMEPAPDATLRDGWWVSRPMRALPGLTLARSDAVPDWRLCHGGSCVALGAFLPAAQDTEAVTLSSCG
jgi:hypothetical protein